uniref:Protein CMSS1 n=1 Tax=Oryza glumipatula TaxID=40148 RepID=A0A0D9ZJ94_9ORYZ
MSPAEPRPPAAATRKRKKPHKPTKTLAKNPTNPVSTKAKKKKKPPPSKADQSASAAAAGGVLLSAEMPPARQLEFLLRSFERAAKMRLSPLELDAYSEGCMVPLAEGASQDVEGFGDHVKGAFGSSWKEELCEGELEGGAIDAGSPALLVICSAALRSLELLRGLKMFTKECRPVKLFAKHMKVEEQVALLKTRVNIACGTPSRIKKLIDMEALSLSRVKLVVLDMQRDAKSFTLFTLPQVSNEFWDLYKGYLDQKVRGGDTRLCFYGAVSEKDVKKVLPSAE